jgi:hypothetical protein
MKATTIKVEGTLLETLEKTKPPKLTLSAYVRTLLERALRQEQMAAAAERYAEFVREAPEESGWLAEWERADLATHPTKKRGRR